jgi:phage baseplate assembly protein W
VTMRYGYGSGFNEMATLPVKKTLLDVVMAPVTFVVVHRFRNGLTGARRERLTQLPYPTNKQKD